MREHTCVNSTQSQDHQKLSYDLICQEILPLVSCDPSLKVKTIISHITTTYNYTPSYRMAWLAKKQGYRANLRKLGGFVQRVTSLHECTANVCSWNSLCSGDDAGVFLNGTCVSGHGIFSRLFWAFQPCI